EIAKAFLEHEGEIQVETATSPLEALVRLETQTFDAVICDYQMPNVDGIQFLKTIRNQGRDTPFILFTGKGREDVAIDALNNGADFYLQKGGDPRAQFTELKNMLQRSVAQRRAMESLRESEEMYEKLFHDNAEAMILVDIKSGLLEDGNTAACALFKYSKEELLRKRVQDLLLGLDGSHSQTLSSLIGTGGAKPGVTIRKANGEVIEVEVFSGTLRVRGKTMGYALISDTSKHERSEVESVKEERKLRGIIDASPTAILMLERDGSITAWNPAAQRLFGWDPTERTPTLASLDFDRRDMGELSAKMMTHEPLYEVEIKRNLPDGSKMIISLSAEPMPGSEGGLGLVAVASNVTERKRMEQRMSHLNEALGLINGILRHDTMNEMSILSGSLDMYERTKQERYLTNAMKAVNRSIELVRRMKELEQMALAGGDLRRTDLRATVEKACRGHMIDHTVDGHATVLADDALSSAIDNVVRNAAIHGKATEIKAAIARTQGEIVLRLSDNGSGIPDSIKPKLFDEGFSYGQTAGSGIGLFLVKKTMERYGGGVSVEDSSPSGATIVMRFPDPDR
ncbi:MAG TPA: PAS domain S-box protein, partial [Methanomassiliicoccales archaeon]|nr:PAS domain S-box protein [Methanomassiliicoccales archaeon]